ncbi:hypothetical protein GCM10022232_81400 [Streptomyces plumbiresistens]|uniref:Uncharacterized protein n=1 Tax=Streptomyces plumbiresistens TaxID=511811 RepID=A0ABP7TCH3_9ACTN
MCRACWTVGRAGAISDWSMENTPAPVARTAKVRRVDLRGMKSLSEHRVRPKPLTAVVGADPVRPAGGHGDAGGRGERSRRGCMGRKTRADARVHGERTSHC